MLRILQPIVLILLILAGISCLTDPVDLGEHDDYVALLNIPFPGYCSITSFSINCVSLQFIFRKYTPAGIADPVEPILHSTV